MSEAVLYQKSEEQVSDNLEIKIPSAHNRNLSTHKNESLSDTHFQKSDQIQNAAEWKT